MIATDPVGSLQSLMSRHAELIAVFSAQRTAATTASTSAFGDRFQAYLSPTTGATTGTAQGSGTGRVSGDDVVAASKKYLGVPYVLGRVGEGGIDCSGLVQSTYRDLGIELPRLVRDQKHAGTEVPSLAQAQPGDLVVTRGGAHIMIYVGNNEIIQAPEPGRNVAIKKLWLDDSGIDTIRRIIPDASAGTSAASATGSQSSLLALQAASILRNQR